jgi:glycopeptide antibiotics resistance protein
MNKTKKFLYGVASLCYLVVLLYFLFFAEGFREPAAVGYHYNFVPFREIGRYLTYYRTIGVGMVVLNLLGNIIAFVPFGFFVPVLGHRRYSFWTVTLFTLEFSVVVELTQLFTRVGSCDIDDVILNTLGGMLGYGLYYLRHRSTVAVSPTVLREEEEA